MVRVLNGTSFEPGMYMDSAPAVFPCKSNMHFNFFTHGTFLCSATCCPGRSVGLGDMHKSEIIYYLCINVRSHKKKKKKTVNCN